MKGPYCSFGGPTTGYRNLTHSQMRNHIQGFLLLYSSLLECLQTIYVVQLFATEFSTRETYYRSVEHYIV